jgi:hypothetical protein
MGIETLAIGLLQFFASRVRFISDGWKRRRRNAAGRLRHNLAVKKEVNEKLWKVLAETNGDAIIRELRRKDSYPAIDESLRSISPWFKVELKGTYHRGIEVITSVESVVIADRVARRAARPSQPHRRSTWSAVFPTRRSKGSTGKAMSSTGSPISTVAFASGDAGVHMRK